MEKINLNGSLRCTFLQYTPYIIYAYNVTFFYHSKKWKVIKIIYLFIIVKSFPRVHFGTCYKYAHNFFKKKIIYKLLFIYEFTRILHILSSKVFIRIINLEWSSFPTTNTTYNSRQVPVACSSLNHSDSQCDPLQPSFDHSNLQFGISFDHSNHQFGMVLFGHNPRLDLS